MPEKTTLNGPKHKMTDILKRADQAAIADVAQTAMSAHEDDELGFDDDELGFDDDELGFDDGPLRPEPEYDAATSRYKGEEPEREPEERVVLKPGDYVTASFTNGELTGVEKTDPVSLTGQLAVEFGATNEFSERRIARLREELADLISDVKRIDAQLEHLNKRRTDAMLACSGISADLRALGDVD